MSVGLKWRKCLITAISNLAVFSVSISPPPPCTHFWIIPAPLHPREGGVISKWGNWTLDRADQGRLCSCPVGEIMSCSSRQCTLPRLHSHPRQISNSRPGPLRSDESGSGFRPRDTPGLQVSRSTGRRPGLESGENRRGQVRPRQTQAAAASLSVSAADHKYPIVKLF